MAVHAIVRSLALAMTLHAVAHRNTNFLKQTIPLSHFAMARLAFRASLQMRLMAEENETGNLIHSLPRYRTIIRVIFRKLHNLRGFLLHTLMAGHAFVRRRNAHRFARIFVFVAILALQAHR